MHRKAHVFPAVFCALAAALTASPAQAAFGPGVLPLAVAASAFAPQQACNASPVPASGMVRQQFAAPTNKMAALLGGQASRLDLIVQQQSAPVVAMQAAFLSTLEPAAGPSFGIVTRPRDCQPQFAAAAVTVPQPALYSPGRPHMPLSPGDFLASKRLSIGHTSFDGAWDRVRREGLPRGTATSMLAASHGRPDKVALAAVNSWTNSRIRYVEDRELYGKSDYWATASETLHRRAGDCEDIAIAKMQLLAAMGVPRDAMYLTIARDLARAADHALLVVRLDGQDWLLDNATDQVLDASESYDYRPIMSFSGNERWLHGY